MPTSETDDFAQAVAAVRAATERMLAGDSGPWKALLSSQDDVVLLGAFGGHLRDRAEVDARFDRTVRVPTAAARASTRRSQRGSGRTWPERSSSSTTTGCASPAAPRRRPPTA